jgi:serine phosphatase RsbU (regulator of sigma subunit)
MLDQRLVSVLNVNSDDNEHRGIMDINDGCDLAILFISKDGSVTMSAGNTNVFVCDGKEVTRYKGQSVFVGEGKLKNKDEVIVHNVPANPDNKFYITSDGLSDQIGGDRRKQFGYRAFRRIILENHREKQAVISGKIWDAFKEYQDEQPRRDDFELITFKP